MQTRNQIKTQVVATNVESGNNQTRTHRKPVRFETETFIPGSRVKGCDTWDRQYDGSIPSPLKTDKQLVSPNSYQKDGFVVNDSDAEESDRDCSESEYCSSDDSDSD